MSSLPNLPYLDDVHLDVWARAVAVAAAAEALTGVSEFPHRTGSLIATDVLSAAQRFERYILNGQ